MLSSCLTRVSSGSARMSNKGEHDSRPTGRPEASPRPTARDVPNARFQQAGVGTSPPRALRGPSLAPGQGAPERIVPEDIELAVLREADTLDGPHIARAAAQRLPGLVSSPPPTPVSVEVPRVRSVPPGLESYSVTPATPTAHSVQSGTLMSIGSVDPRAPTELSLPSPRILSRSERDSYLGPEAVVDRTPESAKVRMPRVLPGVSDGLSSSEGPAPRSNARSVPIGSGGPERNVWRPQPDSPAPQAQNFARAPRSYSPVASDSPDSLAPSYAAHSPARSSLPRSAVEGAPRFQVHSELDAVARELREDNFDLRSASTQREPLASRKPQPSADWISVHEPVSSAAEAAEPFDHAAASRPSRLSQNPSSSSAVTLLVDRAPASALARRDSSDDLQRSRGPRVSLPDSRTGGVPRSWLLVAAGVALLLAGLLGFMLRAPSALRAPAAGPAAAEPSVPHSVAAALTRAPEPASGLRTPGASPTPPVTAAAPVPASPSAVSAPGALTASPKLASSVGLVRPGDAPSSNPPAAPPAAQTPTPESQAPVANPSEGSAKARQSIY